MSQLLTCSKGHSWTNANTDSTCPYCGEAGQAEETVLATEKRLLNELPPPPRRPQSGEQAAASLPKMAGYEIEGVLGRGGMGVVYKARQLSLGRVVALKMILAGVHLNAESLARFRGEAHTLARVSHPNIVHIYDVMDVDGTPCFAMEYVDGDNLEEQLGGRPMPPRQAATLVRTLARAVQVAHDRGVIHRDLKPANVLIAADGTPKITDFGLAKRLDDLSDLTKTGDVMGTPHYMAPEQAEKTKSVGPEADIYALGAILYQALTGAPPFRGKSAAQVLKQVLFDEPKPPSQVQAAVPARLDAVCLKCLSKDPNKRFPTAQALAEELDQFLSAPALPMDPLAPPKTAKKPAWALATLLILAIIVGVGFVPGVRDWLFSSAALGPGGSRTPHWELLAKPAADAGEAFDRIAFPSRDLGYLASRQALYKTEDAGKTWTKQPFDSPSRVNVLHFVDASHGWLGTDQLRQTADGGKTWNAVALDGETMQSVTALTFHANGWGLAGGTTQEGKLALFQRANSASIWEKIEAAGAFQPYADWFVAALNITGPTTALAVLFEGVESGGAVLSTKDSGRSWSKVFGADEDLHGAFINLDGHGWLTGFRGALWHTTDGGARFQSVDAKLNGVTPTCLAFDTSGKIGMAPLWKGNVMLKIGDHAWTNNEVPLGYALPHAVMVDSECGYVLAADGQAARLTLRP